MNVIVESQNVEFTDSGQIRNYLETIQKLSRKKTIYCRKSNCLF